MTADLTEVNDLAERYSPMLMFRDVDTARMWVADGCDVKRDILPTMKQLMAKNQRIMTFSYFTDAIYRARDERKAAAEYVARKPLSQEKAIENLRWKKKMGMYLSQAELDVLAQYGS